MRNASHGSDATIEWMTADVAKRCREAVGHLETPRGSARHLADAAMLLRAAADDLVSLVELVEGPAAAARLRVDAPFAFDVSFRNAPTHSPTD